MSGGMQASRYECKYLIDPVKAERIRDFVLVHLEPDSFTNPKTYEGYPVHSLYLDSPDLKLCRQTLGGEKNRFKLRIRFYDDNPSSPVFLEIKRRMQDIILKQRAGVWRSAIPDILSHKFPSPSMLVKQNEKSLKALRNFFELSEQIGAQPAAYTSYRRAAFEPPDDNRCRVTFDDELRAGEFKNQLGVGDLTQWEKPQINGVVLELKFTDRRPDWMGEVVSRFGLQRISVPKYVECMSLVDRHWASRLGGAERIAHDVPLSLLYGRNSGLRTSG